MKRINLGLVSSLLIALSPALAIQTLEMFYDDYMLVLSVAFFFGFTAAFMYAIVTLKKSIESYWDEEE